jgi:glycine/D-amino acid oxidase-like deaminating enzyme
MSQPIEADPFWWEEAPRPALPEQPLPGTVDVVVVGSVYAGLSAALVLARAGRSVAVLERDRIGEGGSTRNGGITSGNIRIGFGAMIRRFGLERAKAVYGEGREARAALARFLAEEGIACHYGDVGRFTGAVRPAHYEHLAREADLLNRHLDLGAEMVPRIHQRRELGTDLYHGGMLRPDIGGLHPGLYHQGLLDRVLETGTTVHGEAPATGIRREGDGFEVASRAATVRARDVVVTTNAYTGAELPWLHRRIVPIPSQIIATEPLDPEMMDRLMPRRRMCGDTYHLSHYFRPSPDSSRILFGGRGGAGTGDPQARHRHLLADLRRIFPELADVRITHSWWGHVGFTFDFLPKLTVHEGVHYATGFCGSGTVWAWWLGRKAALALLGEPEAASAFASDSFPTRPLYRGRPWFMPAVMSWFALRDRMGI